MADKNFQNENSNEQKNSKNSETEKTLNQILKMEKICSKACRICKSGLIEKIHEMKKAGRTFDEMREILAREDKFEIAKSSLSNHFANWNAIVTRKSAEIVSAELVDEVAKRAEHTREIVGLIDTAIVSIKTRVKVGMLFDVADLEKLVNIKYKTLAGEDSGEIDLLGIFQKAKDKYGCEMSQASLFAHKNKSS